MPFLHTQGLGMRLLAQLLNELKATGLKVGLPVNFGRTKVQFKRMVY
jgi:L-amino acid N-acyltransferase YncA